MHDQMWMTLCDPLDFSCQVLSRKTYSDPRDLLTYIISYWGLDEVCPGHLHGPLEKGMANHFSILDSRTP